MRSATSSWLRSAPCASWLPLSGDSRCRQPVPVIQPGRGAVAGKLRQLEAVAVDATVEHARRRLEPGRVLRAVQEIDLVALLARRRGERPLRVGVAGPAVDPGIEGGLGPAHAVEEALG